MTILTDLNTVRQNLNLLKSKAVREKVTNGITEVYLMMSKEIALTYENLFKKTRTSDDLCEAVEFYVECGDVYNALMLTLAHGKDKVKKELKERVMSLT